MHMPTPKEGAKMRLLCIFDKPYIYTYALGIFSTGEKSSFSRRPIFNSFRKRQLLPIFVYITFFAKSVYFAIYTKSAIKIADSYRKLWIPWENGTKQNAKTGISGIWIRIYFYNTSFQKNRDHASSSKRGRLERFTT